MKTKLKIAACLAVVGLSSTLLSAIRPGENVLLNPGFTAPPGKMPFYWDPGQRSDVVTAANLLEAGGIPCLTLTGVSGNKGANVRQYGLRLKAGGRYRLSAKVRTEGYQSAGRGRFHVCSSKWRWSDGFNFPSGTHGWQPLSRVFTAENSVGGLYFAVIHIAKPFKGKVQISEAKLEALDEDTGRETSSSEMAAAIKKPRLVPWSPLLNEIPADNPVVSFRFFGELPRGTAADYVVYVTCGTTVAAPLVESLFVLLPNPEAEGKMTVRIVNRISGETAFSRTYDYALVDRMDDPTPARRLNNLTVEYYNEQLGVGATVERRLALPRTRWVMIRAEADSVTLDGNRVITTETPRQETFRELSRGVHAIRIEGAKGGRLIVRGIPELFDYSVSPSVVKENPPFDWTFAEDYVLPAVTTFNGGNVPKNKVAGLKARGCLWLGNMHSMNLKTDDELLERLADARGINDAAFDGVTCDEQYLTEPDVMSHFSDALWRYSRPDEKRVYSWVCGGPEIAGVDHDVVAVTVNATKGRGKLLNEFYAATYPTEAEARDYLTKWFRETLAKYDAFSPVYRPRYGAILGNYSQLPVCSLWGNPEVDFRYYLDMQFNMIANDPAFKDIGCTGVWGSRYAEEEVHRWTFMLMRHYFIEGRREMLSPKYGFKYISGHLRNGDFAEGMNGWTATGDVGTGRRELLGKSSQGRRSGQEGEGDAFVVLTQGTNEVATLTQTLRGLVPGKKYCLRYGVFDAREVAAMKRGAKCEYALKAVFPSEVEIDRVLSWSHVDERATGAKGARNAPRVNMRHVVFTASRIEFPLVFTTEGAAPGDSFALNAVSAHPYLCR